MSAIDIRGVAHRFGDLRALDGVDLSVAQGEFFSLLGPSGCGKTTLLNIIAGFLAPSAGSIVVGGRDVTRLPPHRRDIGMVFQNYALFPHLNVFDNVAYGLRVRKSAGGEVRARVDEMLALVRLSELAQRMPHQLSGGQQQRVAIARALAIRPQVLLLDEPLSNLDARLRKDMQAELRRLQRDVGITTVMVTHDQEEALGLSDRIGILGAGRLQQVGTPLALYRHPANRFVGEFVGQANLVAARTGADGLFVAVDHFAAPDAPLLLASTHADTGTSAGSSSSSNAGKGTALFLLRPERIRLSPADGQHSAAFNNIDNINSINGTVRDVSYAGATMHITVALARGALTVETPEAGFAEVPQTGAAVRLAWDAGDLTLLPAFAEAGLA